MRTFDCLSVCVRACVFAHICGSYSVFWCRRGRAEASAHRWGTTRFHSKSTHCWKLALKTTEHEQKKIKIIIFPLLCDSLRICTANNSWAAFRSTRSRRGSTLRETPISSSYPPSPVITGPVLASSGTSWHTRSPGSRPEGGKTQQWVDPLRRSWVIRLAKLAQRRGFSS